MASLANDTSTEELTSDMERLNTGAEHGHSHNGKPCDGHGHSHQAKAAPKQHQHGHSHNGKPCHGHGHSHGAPPISDFPNEKRDDVQKWLLWAVKRLKNDDWRKAIAKACEGKTGPSDRAHVIKDTFQIEYDNMWKEQHWTSHESLQ